MTAEQFAYWLNGFIELTEWKQPTPEQWKSICEHVGTVFEKVTPPVSEAPKSIEQALRQYREGNKIAYPPNLPMSPYFTGAPVITC